MWITLHPGGFVELAEIKRPFILLLSKLLDKRRF